MTIQPPLDVDAGGTFASLARADFDGDGVTDLARGQFSIEHAGKIVLISGATRAAIRAIIPPLPWEPGDGFGQTVIAFEDLDGDSLPDLIAGFARSVQAARVEAYSSATGQRLWTRPSPIPNLAFGWSLAESVDMNADGVLDLIVGAPSRCSMIPFACGMIPPQIQGMTVLCSGADGTVLLTLQSGGNPALGTTFGHSVTASPDLDGDSIADLIAVSGPPSVNGGGGYEVQAFSGATGAFLGSLDSGSSSNKFPRVSRFSDVNEDGLPEFLLSCHDTPFLYLGTLACISGSGGGRLWSRQSNLMGSSHSVTDDFDGDGIGEVIASNQDTPSQYGLALLSGATGITLWSTVRVHSQNQAGGDFEHVLSPDLDRNGDGRADILALIRDAPYGNELVCFSSADGSTIFTLDHNDGMQAFGAAILEIDDMDGDGLRDLLVGAPRWSSASVRHCGSAYLMSSGTGASILRFDGSTYGQLKGMTLADLGDVNGDAIPDFAIGSPYFGSGSMTARRGRIDVHSGSDGATLWSRIGVNPGDNLGMALCRVPDLNNDGVAELATSQLGTPPTSTNSVRILNGTNGNDVSAITPQGSTSRFGTRMVLGGDLNGDGQPDLLVGSGVSLPTFFWANPTLPIQPRFFVDGLNPGRLHAFSLMTGTPLWTTPIPAIPDATGANFDAIPDLNDDGVHEIVSGVPASGYSGSALNQGGELRILSGVDGQIMASVATGFPSEHFGIRVVSIDDQDGDALPEFAGLALSNATGTTIPGLMPYKNRLRIYSGASRECIGLLTSASYTEYADSDGFGYSLVSIRDIDADGFRELAIGAPNRATTLNGLRTGAVSLESPRPASWSEVSGSECSMLVNGTPSQPTIGTLGGFPSVQSGNSSFAITLDGAPPDSVATLLYGPVTSSWSGLPIPLPLVNYGFPGCFLGLAPVGYQVVPMFGSLIPGSTTISTPIPSFPAASGAAFRLQWVVTRTVGGTVHLAATKTLRLTLF